jgi:PAS domain-containing protein
MTLLSQLAATSLESLELNRTIQDNELRLRILVDAAPVSIVESDETGRVRWWNRSASRLLRWPDFASDASSEAVWPREIATALDDFWSDLLAGCYRVGVALRTS